jgi:DNA-binding CsgD family transcriptional regulator
MAGRRFFHGDLETATAYLTAADARLRELADHPPTRATTRLLTNAALIFGDLATVRGEFPLARTRYREARTLAERNDLPQLVAIATMDLGKVAHLAGDLPAAQELLEDALTRHQAVSQPVTVALGHLWLGQLLVARRSYPHALAQLAAAFTTFADGGHLGLAAWALEELAGIALTATPDIAVQLLAAAALPGHDVIHPQASVDLGQAARARLGPAAFEAAWETGTRLTPDEVRAVVRDLAATIARPSDAALARADAHGLTPREREVLRLVAAGQSNREIAAALFISVPTVKRHLTTILGKLDLPSRSAATAWAHTHHLT